MSTQILRINRPIISSLNAFKCYFEQRILVRTNTNKNQISYYHCSHHRQYCDISYLGQSMCRTFYTSSSKSLINVRKLLDTNDDHSSDTDRYSAPKVYEEKEASFYHNFLKRSSSYVGSIHIDDPKFLETYKLSDIEYRTILETRSWNGKLPSDIFKAFISLGLYESEKQNMTIEDKSYEGLISDLVNNLHLSTDNELIDCLIALKHWPKQETHKLKDKQVLKVWKALDNVCYKRNLDWTTDKSLYVMDLWYHLGCFKNSFFVYKALLRISRKTDEFTAAQLIQALFYMSCKRTINPLIALREYEYFIQQYITKLTIEEIGIFSLAFFKTKTSIINKKVLMYIMQRTVEEADTIDSVVVSAIAKVIRFSHKPDIGFTANDMVNKLIARRWDSFSLTTGIHLVHISTQVQFYDEESLSKLAEKFCKNPSEARLKEMERIAFFLSLYNFIPTSASNVCQLIEEQLNNPSRETELNKYPLMYLSLLYFLSLLRVFPEKHICRVTDEKRLFGLYENKFCIPMQTVQLDYNRVLEGPAGSEHLLSPELREYLTRRYSMYIPNEKYPPKNQFDGILSEVMEFSNKLLGTENYLVTYTLPHFPRADILFRLDDSGKPLPIPEEMKSLPHFDDVHRPVGPGKWYCVMIGGRNMYMHNVPRLVGEQTTKIRQLKSIGYTPILIPSFYWRKEEDKMAYLKLKYFSGNDKNK